jgi:ribosomal protein S18 acetylase RimI-like enzyme
LFPLLLIESLVHPSVLHLYPLIDTLISFNHGDTINFLNIIHKVTLLVARRPACLHTALKELHDLYLLLKFRYIMAVENVIIRKAEESDYPAILEFIYEDFLPRELLSIVSGNVSNINQSARDDRFLHWLLDEVSLVAVDTEDQTLAGIAVNFVTKKEDHEEENDNSTHQVTQVSRPLNGVLKFIEKLEEGQNLFEELNTTRGMDLRFLGVKEKYSGRGIASQLTEQTLELARNCSLKFVQSIPTSPATLHLFEKLGFETRSELKCQGFFLDDGLPAFPHASSSDKSRYVVKIL